MKLFQLYITENAVDRTGDWNRIIWKRTVKAVSRLGALYKCIPELQEQVLSLIEDPTIRFISVYCGHKVGENKANRMRPIQITREGSPL